MDLEEAMWLAWQGIRPPISPEVEEALGALLTQGDAAADAGIDWSARTAAPDGKGGNT